MSELPSIEPWLEVGGMLAWLALAGGGLATVLAIALIVAGDRWPSNRAGAIAIGALPLALLAVTVLACVAIVERARHVVIAADPQGALTGMYALLWMADVEAQLAIAGAAVVGVPLAVGAFVRTLRLEGWQTPAIAAAGAGIVVVAGLGLAGYAWPLAFGWATSGMARATLLAGQGVESARVAVLATSLLAAVVGCVAAVLLGRRRRIAGAGAWIGAGALALLGAFAWWGTRARAWDAAHPLEPERMGTVAWPLGTRLPEVTRCSELAPAPVLEVTAGAPHEGVLDGRRIDREMLAADLDTMKRNWTILHPHRAFRGTLLILADRSLSRAALSPWSEIARGRGYGDVRRVVVRRIVQRTATLRGRVVYRMCDVPYTR